MGISLNKDLLGAERAALEGIRFHRGRGDIKIGVVNLMPYKDEVEYQFFTVLGRYEERVEVEFLYPSTHRSKNSSMDYLRKNYYPLHQFNDRRYDAIIVTGAPVEEIPFEDVTYWREVHEFFKKNTLPSIYICWGAQGALYSKYNIEKFPLGKKLFGIYDHTNHKNPFISSNFPAPHSRNTYNRREGIEGAGLKVLSYSEEAGVYMCSSPDYRDIFISGHGEYQRERLQYEYARDSREIPENYFPEDNPDNEPLLTWDTHRKEFYKNWLNFIRSRR